MSDSAVAIWIIAVSVISLNGFAAGVVAALFAWRSRMRRGVRIVMGAAGSGLLSGIWMIPITTDQMWAESRGPLVLGLVFAAVFGVAMIVSLPGALIVGRKLDRAGDEFRAFE